MEKLAETEHPIRELLRRRWSPRAFDPRPIPAEVLRSALEAARWAPSCFNDQPWFFIVARREDDAGFETMLECLVDGNRSWARNAGALLLSVARTAFAHNGKPNRHAAHDVGLATAQLTLQALADGVWTHQMGGIRPERARELYRVPAGFEVLTGIALGYPGDPADLPDALESKERGNRSRNTQDTFVFERRWSRPAAF